MYGVFVMCETDWAEKMGLEDQRIHLFATEGDAEDWQLACLLKAGYVEQSEGGFRLTDLADSEQSGTLDRSGVIEAWQCGLGVIDFFHCYQMGE